MPGVYSISPGCSRWNHTTEPYDRISEEMRRLEPCRARLLDEYSQVRDRALQVANSLTPGRCGVEPRSVCPLAIWAPVAPDHQPIREDVLYTPAILCRSLQAQGQKSNFDSEINGRGTQIAHLQKPHHTLILRHKPELHRRRLLDDPHRKPQPNATRVESAGPQGTK